MYAADAGRNAGQSILRRSGRTIATWRAFCMTSILNTDPTSSNIANPYERFISICYTHSDTSFLTDVRFRNIFLRQCNSSLGQESTLGFLTLNP